MFGDEFLTAKDAFFPKAELQAMTTKEAKKYVFDQFNIFDNAFPLLIAGVPAKYLPKVVEARETLARLFVPLRENPSSFHAAREAYFNGKLNESDRSHLQIGMLWASQANTIPAAFWAIAFILSDKKAQDAIRAEIDSIAAGCAKDEKGRVLFSKSDLNNMRMMESAINEAFRLSTSSMSMRVAEEDFELEIAGEKKYAIKKGEYVCLFPPVTHYDSEIYSDPFAYQWDRYYSENPQNKKEFFKDGKPVKSPLVQFGGGVSMCPGRNFAFNEIKLFVANFVMNFETELLSVKKPWINGLPALNNERAGLGILPPAEDIGFRIRLRK